MSTEATILHRLSDAMHRAATELAPGVPDLRAAEARLANGIPGLTGEPLIGWDGLLRNARDIVEALGATDAGEAASLALKRLEDVPAWSDGESVTAIALAGAWNALPEEVATVLDYAARPALRAGAAALRPALDTARWMRGHCPACGAPPALSVVSGKEHERTLHCARCATAWAFARTRCPACGERSHERLGYLHAAGQGEHRRAEVCDSCGTYLKSVALLDRPDADRLLQLDLETAALDFLALDRGYARGLRTPPPA